MGGFRLMPVSVRRLDAFVFMRVFFPAVTGLASTRTVFDTLYADYQVHDFLPICLPYRQTG